MSNKILVIGYGNVGRQDDGAGVHVADRLRSRVPPQVTVWTAHQLELELLEELDPFHTLILLDAGHQEPDVALRQIQADQGDPRLVSSHHLSPELLARLARTLYHRTLRLFVCSIRAEQFELDDRIRPALEPRLRRAEEMVLTLIQKEQHHA